MPNNRATSEQIIEDLEEERLEQLLDSKRTHVAILEQIHRQINPYRTGGEE